MTQLLRHRLLLLSRDTGAYVEEHLSERVGIIWCCQTCAPVLVKTASIALVSSKVHVPAETCNNEKYYNYECREYWVKIDLYLNTNTNLEQSFQTQDFHIDSSGLNSYPLALQLRILQQFCVFLLIFADQDAEVLSEVFHSFAEVRKCFFVPRLGSSVDPGAVWKQ